jgi:peptide/nickel transport system permease protein
VIRAFLRAPSGVLSLAVIALIALVALIAPPIWGDQARVLDTSAIASPPTDRHPLGTDNLGRDILYRLLVATRLSVVFGLSAAAIGAFIGIPFGAIAAILPPRPRSIALRAIDSLIAFPGILVAIIIGAIFGSGLLGPIVGLGVAISFSFARVTSALALSIAGRDYIAAARIVGVRGTRMLLRYVLPNIAETLAITTTVGVATSVVAAASLSFLGLGVQPPDYDWGRMLTEGVQAFYISPMAALGPATFIAVTSLAFGFLGEALARASNPILWTTRAGMARAISPVLAPELELETPVARVDEPRVAAARPANGKVVLDVRDLCVSFQVPVVHDVSFSLRASERLGIVGESGSGKTMTAMAIAQLVPYPGTVRGTIELEGQDLATLPARARDRLLGTRLAVVYQDPLASLNPALKVGTQIMEGAEVHRNLAGRPARALAATRLREVNIPTPEMQLQRHPHELSGGMRQRVVIAMGLVNEPALLIADEPTTSLDVTVQAQIMDVIARVNADHGTAIILISHNMGLISQNCDRVIVMYAGRIVEDLPAEHLSTLALHPYTRALLRSVPDMTRARSEDLEFIGGQAPDPAALPSGCSYHPRCPLAVDRCRTERPPLRDLPDGRRVACWVATGEA